MLEILIWLFTGAVGVVTLIAAVFGFIVWIDRRTTKRWEAGYRPKWVEKDPAYD